MRYVKTAKFLLILSRSSLELRKAADIAFKKFKRDPSSVNFKQLFGKTYSARVTESEEGYRMIGRLIDNTVYWEFIGTHEDYIVEIQHLRRGRKLPEARRKPFIWKIAGKLMDPPDAEGEIFWIVEIDVASGFPGYPKHGHPTVQFMAGTKAGHWIDPPAQHLLKPPVYRYMIEIDFHTASGVSRDISLRVVRCWDAEGNFCRPNKNNGNYAPSPQEAVFLAGSLEEGIWQAIINGNVRDQVGVYEQLFENIAPFLLEMSKAPEMQKMEEIYLGTLISHSTLHTDTGYEESLGEVVEKDKKVLRPILRMPSPKVIKISRPVEHSELHTDTSESEYDS